MDAVHYKRQVKFHLDGVSHDQVRLAAAIKHQTIAAFCREVVLREAERIAANVTIREEGT